MKLYVGNLPWSIGDQELEDLFSDYSVVSAKVIKDRNTDRSRGFGFVELEIKDSWIDLWQLLALTAFGAYFGGRSVEKIKK